MNVLITGGNGYVAKSLYNALRTKYNVMTITRDNFDLTNSEATNTFFQHRLFDVVIHCAVKGGSRLKADDPAVLDDNLKMYYNLLANKKNYDKLIHFGSGAELVAQDTLYGLSKHVIRESILKNDNCYNLRIYAVFDENELDTRFIKANVLNYINKQPIRIHQDRVMSFFYMKDLVKLVEYYLVHPNPQKEIYCCYNTVYTLGAIAGIINNLDTHKVDIIKETTGRGNGYYGENLFIPNIEYLGLEYGIKEVYNKLKCS